MTTTSGATTTSSYIGSLEEVASDGATTTTTASYGGLALSVNGALSYTLSDGLGSVSASVNANTGAVSATQLYGPYGAVREQSGALPTSYGYTHQRSDAVSGLDYYGARYYDPLAGQFTSADTTLAGGLNRYAYVGGNPETHTDPTGHDPWWNDQTSHQSPPDSYDPASNYNGYINNGPWTDQHRNDPDVLPVPIVNDQRNFYKQALTDEGKFKRGFGVPLSSAEQQALSEWEDAGVLANYFQLSVFVRNEGKSDTSADYQIGVQKPWLLSSTAYAMFYPTTAEQYAPTSGKPLPDAMRSTAITAAQEAYRQSPFMVVDISYSPSLSKMTDAQIRAYANLILYPQPGSTRSTGAARVIIIRGGEVVLDLPKPGTPLFGPSKSSPPMA